MPIRLRLALIVAAIACVLVVLGGVAFEASLSAGMRATLEDFLRRSAHRLERDLADRRVLLSAANRRARPVDDQSILQVLRRGGRVGYTTSRAGPSALLTGRLRREALRGPVFVQRADRGWHDPRLLLAEAVPGRPGLVTVVGASLDELINARGRLLQTLFVGGPLVVLIAGVGTWLLAGVALRPVERLRGEAMAISTSDPDRRLAVPRSRDEIARLARTLNDLLDLLQGSIARHREFVAAASHELRTPLAVVRAEVELAQHPSRTPDDVRASLNGLAPRIEQLVRLSDDLLLLASGDEGALRLHVAIHQLEPLVAMSLQALSTTAESRGIALLLDAEPGVTAAVDAVRFQQIVDNLVANAVDYATATPIVEVSVRRVPGCAVVEVRDRGPGFPEEFLPLAFGRFTRATNSRTAAPASGDAPRPLRRGVGLGLAVVRLLAEAHGGTAQATNRPKGGARVVVTIPTTAQWAHPATSTRDPGRAPRSGGARG